jgi:hypothetical protein
VLLRGFRTAEELSSGRPFPRSWLWWSAIFHRETAVLLCSAEPQIRKAPRGLLSSVAKEAKIMEAEHTRQPKKCKIPRKMKFCPSYQKKKLKFKLI